MAIAFDLRVGFSTIEYLPAVVLRGPSNSAPEVIIGPLPIHDQAEECGLWRILGRVATALRGSDPCLAFPVIRGRRSNRNYHQLCGPFRKAAHRCTSDSCLGSDPHRMLAFRAWKIIAVRLCRRGRYESFALQLERLRHRGDCHRDLPCFSESFPGPRSSSRAWWAHAPLLCVRR